MITIELTSQEAILFRKYQQVADNFQTMHDAGVFDTVNGSVEIHFDNDGNIRVINKHDTLYKR